MLYGGGKGGGKSFLESLWIDHWADWLINFFGLKPSTRPLPVGFWGRKRGVDFYRTTFETFQRVIPQNHYIFREKQQELIFRGCLKFHVGGLDNQKTISKFNSAEYCVIALDQAEETNREDISVLKGAMRLTHKGKIPPYKSLYTANPADCHLKEDFIDDIQPRHYFIPALYKDNPHLPPNYAQTLRNAFRYNKALLAAYLDGDWHALKAENALLSSEDINSLRDVIIYPKEIRRVMACDPSLGGDTCVIYAIENNRIIDAKEMYERDAMKIAGEILVMSARNKVPNFAADTTGGLGSAILDRIKEIKRGRGEYFYLNASEGADNDEAFANLRMEMAWSFMEQVGEKVIPFPEDPELRRQLQAYRFKVINSNGKTQLEDKKEIKKRLSRSPDNGDCYILGCWACKKSQPVKAEDVWSPSWESGEIMCDTQSAMAA